MKLLKGTNMVCIHQSVALLRGSASPETPVQLFCESKKVLGEIKFRKRKGNVELIANKVSVMLLNRCLCCRITVALRWLDWAPSPVIWRERPSVQICSEILQRAELWCSSGWNIESPSWIAVGRMMPKPF